MQGRKPRWRIEWWIPAIYAAASSVWIYGSDTLVAAIAGSMERQRSISVYKGFGFVVVSAVLLYAGLRWALRRERASAQRVEEGEALLRAITDAIPDPIFLKGLDGRRLFVNPASLKTIGKPLEQVLGKTDAEIYDDPAVSAALVETDRRIMATGVGEMVEERVFGPQGFRTFLTSKAPYLNADGQVIGLIGSAHDITERKRAVDALRESEARFASMAENSPVAIYRYSDRRGGLYYSPRSMDLLGYSPEELLADPLLWINAIHPEDRPQVDEALKATLPNQSALDFTYRIRHASGQERWFRERATSRRHPDGELITDGVAMDITDIRRAEEEKAKLQTKLQQTQKMENLGSLAGGVAHDMNNVLGAILGLASANIQGQAVESPAYQAFQTIIRAAERGGQMVKGLLTLARQTPAEERELDMNELLQEEARLLERTTLSKIRLELDLASELRPIRGDPGALIHVFMNLCVNAVDAMPENGTLTLRTRNVDNDWIEVMVEDTGTGMPKEVLEKALDPFYTTKGVGKGTGLGLSLVYSTVRAHQGQLEIQSEPGQGTRVRMRFPACEPAAKTPAPAAEPRSESAHRALNVLVVDDDELIRSAMSPLLEVLGHRAIAVSCGEEALAKLEAGFQPDVIILDMNMPGLGGAGTLPRLRLLRPTTPVLLATGRVDQSASDLVETHPYVTLLSKPFSIAELKRHLEPLGQGQ